MSQEISQQKPRKISFLSVLFVIAAIVLVLSSGYALIRPQSQPAANPKAQVASRPTPHVPSGSGVPAALNMGMEKAAASITTLQAPPATATEKHFTLVAEPSQISIDSASGPGSKIAAWTFNGTAPGPTLRVRQGDLVVVTLVNRLTFGVTIHWHGIDVPNAMDGVAGVTQDAVKPGQSFVYRFVAKDPGTYWYHSHQFSYEETTGGLYGTIIVDPAVPAIHADLDLAVSLHDWVSNSGQTLVLDTSTGIQNKAAQPGQWVRLRLVNTSSNQHVVTLVGAAFKVVALDGHDLNGPQELRETPLPIGAAQRYDLLFQMPMPGNVSLVTSADNQHYQQMPAVVIGRGTIAKALPAVKQQWFDLTNYGVPRQGGINGQSHFDASYNIALGTEMGDSLGRSGMVYTLNGKVFPQTGMIMVHEGELVRLHLDNQSDLVHPMHLHGHVFTVLTHNSKALTGSPIQLDTINIQPHDSYDIGFVANNPGIWMLHCHNLLHANWGMDMMIMYNMSTPYTIGSFSGNFPD
jgi:FtsP/CotA-like multicopper oxidase with cupredoxin domain